MIRTYGPSFEKLYAAAIGTRLGDAARTSALAVLAAELTGSPAVLSLVSAMSFAPWLLFGIPAGALIDRWDKRRAFLTADSIRCALAALMTGLALAGWLSVGTLIVFAFLLTSLQTVSDGCFNSLLPSTVAKEDLGQANARLSASQSTAGIAAAPLGSWLASLSSALPFLLNVVTFGAAASWVRALPADADRRSAGQQARKKSRSLVGDIREGLASVRKQGLLQLLLVCVSVNNFCNGLSSAVLPILAIRELGMRPAAFGILTGATAACMVIGNLVAGRLAARKVPHARVSGVAIGLKLPGFLLICTAQSPAFLVAGAALLGLAAGLWNVPSSTLLMTSAPQEVIGRTMALFRTLSVAGMPLGAVASGLLATAAGVRSSSLAAAALSGAVLAGFLWQVRKLGKAAEPADDSTPDTVPART
ncbi:MFS transporter [Kitasatospora sp. RB6PN24]|uniref:MFS transporter n=1 Tax=Kitasatospora humi TaxID=2893891 RepID=UPI001E5A5EB9|nr:MFS transporter [Kitasatospora humi]MCC9309746.1 MFS transporter [Kitasatospora humi]